MEDPRGQDEGGAGNPASHQRRAEAGDREGPRGGRAAAAIDRQAARRERLLGAIALLVLVAVAWALFIRGGSDSEDPGGGGAEPVSEEVRDYVEGFSPEDLVDQVLLVGFDGTDGTAPYLSELRERQVGGVLLRSENWFGPEQGGALLDAIDEAGALGGEVPALVAVAQEGGRYRSLADLPPDQTELEIGDDGSPKEAKEWAQDSAAALREVGIDLDLFPVADVATLDSPIADRAFSDDPEIVARQTAAALRGCAAAELACAPLHFPGLGAASQDTSEGPATVSLDAAALAERDLEPFRAAFAAGAPAVVLSLALYAAYDPVTPGALAPSVATELLRDDLGFSGVAITDDLGSGAVRAGLSAGEGAVAAIEAGADLIQIAAPEDEPQVRAALLETLEDGDLSEERLAEAAGRVIEMKRSLGLFEPPEN